MKYPGLDVPPSTPSLAIFSRVGKIASCVDKQGRRRLGGSGGTRIHAGVSFPSPGHLKCFRLGATVVQ